VEAEAVVVGTQLQLVAQGELVALVAVQQVEQA
jgi:hypothetical protein